MPVTKSPVSRPHDLDHLYGTGGRGPDHRLPTGGGGDDENWAERPEGHRGPRERLSKYRLLTGLGLIAIVTLFVGLGAAYILRKNSGHLDFATGLWVQDWRPIALPKILWLSTAMLICASACIEVARRAMFHPTDTVEEWLGLGYLTGRRSLPWLLATFAFGAVFFFAQYEAWQALAAQGIYYGTSAKFFYILTGAHAAHMAVGVLALIAALIATLIHSKLENRQIIIDITAWYWHAMSVVWIGLFALLVFAR